MSVQSPPVSRNLHYGSCSNALFAFSNHSYGSHKNRPFKDESHKGSLETLDGEEKKDASKEDLEGERGETGMCVARYRNSTISP